jgi:hypothetical protein
LLFKKQTIIIETKKNKVKENNKNSKDNKKKLKNNKAKNNQIGRNYGKAKRN